MLRLVLVTPSALATLAAPLILGLAALQPRLLAPLLARLRLWRRRSPLRLGLLRLSGRPAAAGVSPTWHGAFLDAGQALALLMAACALGADLPPARLAVAGGLGLVLLWLVLFDLRWLRLPDRLTLPLALAGLADAVARDAAVPGLATGLAAGAALLALREAVWRWKGVEGLGLGDVKLAAAMGLWLGPDWFGPALFGAALAGIAGHLSARVLCARLAGGQATAEQPFGPWLALALWAAWLAREAGLPPPLFTLGFGAPV